MIYLYGTRIGQSPQLVATFDTEPQLRAYVGWATLKTSVDGSSKFEQGSPLVGFTGFKIAAEPSPGDDPENVVHNPSPSML